HSHLLVMYSLSHNEGTCKQEMLKMQVLQRLSDYPTTDSLGVSGNAGYTHRAIREALYRYPGLMMSSSEGKALPFR
ncbi:MAG TPA: hypothetical protein VLH40_01710, partial [Atribacteraceae bacterium]|nr:hypothetical protein [Atribacteraceae bacterium]